MKVKINYRMRSAAAKRSAAKKNLFRASVKDAERVSKIVDNPSVINSYSPQYSYQEVSKPGIIGNVISAITGKTIGGITGKGIINEGEQYDYVIITSREFADLQGEYTFQTLVNWKESKGLRARIVTTEDIFESYSGRDEQEKIRNFTKDAYLNWNTQYVLLGGDADGGDVGGESGDNIVPVRKLWILPYDEGWQDVASDVYYSNLDGSFDYDNDNVFGEDNDGENGEEVDLYAEVFVGRAPVDSALEIENFVRKTIMYENAYLKNESWLKNSLMAGEDLGWSTASIYKDEIKDGSDSYGYSTEGLPETMNVDILYDNTYYDDGQDYWWDKSELVSKMNNNELSEINHLGHASTCYVMRLCNAPQSGGGYCSGAGVSDIDNLQNQKPFFAYSQGCYPGSFDNWNYNGYYTTCDSAGEHFITSSNGAFAVIMNSRYGWGMWYPSTDGASQRHDRRFFDAIYGQRIQQLGKANAYAKEGLIGYIPNDDLMRGVYWETNLLGDPETSLYIPEKPEHDLAVKKIEPDSALMNEQVEIKALIKNQGKNDENNFAVSLYVNGNFAERKTIDSLNSDENTSVSFDYTFTQSGDNLVFINISSVAGEENIRNNQLNKNVDVVSLILTGEYGDYGVDSNGNGKYNSIIVDAGLRVIEEQGIYVVAYLKPQDSYYSVADFFDAIRVKPEDSSIQLVFDTGEMAEEREDGPYDLGIGIYDSEGNPIYSKENVYTTAYYSWRDFDVPKDIRVWFDYMDTKKLVDRENKIGVNLYNYKDDLDEPVKLYLYEVEEIYEKGNGTKEKLTLVDSKLAALRENERKRIDMDWIPRKTGHIELKVVANISDDIYPDDNDDYEYFEVGIPSVIKNTGEFDIKGYLVMKIQYFNDSSNESGWADAEVVVNDYTTQNLRIIRPGEIFELTEIFNSVIVRASPYGNCGGEAYFCKERVYAALLSKTGEVIFTDDNNALVAVSEFWIYKGAEGESLEEKEARLRNLLR